MSSNNRRSHTPLERPDFDVDVFESMGIESALPYLIGKYGTEVNKVMDFLRFSECEGFYFHHE